MIFNARQRSVLLYGTTIFGAFTLILLIIITIFTRYLHSASLFDESMLRRYEDIFAGYGVLFIPVGLLFAYVIGWIISLELHPKRTVPPGSITVSDAHISEGEQFRERMHSVRNTISNMQTAYDQIRSFSANASHELRTPLTIMRGEIELALRSPKTPEEYQRLLGSLFEEILRLSRILDDLLLIAKTEIGERPIELQAVDLREMVEEIADEAAVFAEASGITVTLGPVVDALIEAEPLRIRRVMLNLLDNAVKYNRKNGTVTLSMAQEDDMVAVVIKDSGIGIPASALPRLFERFYRVTDSEITGPKGTGLGLYFVEWIVRHHGGSITVDSEEGQGSAFTIRFPLRNTGV